MEFFQTAAAEKPCLVENKVRMQKSPIGEFAVLDSGAVVTKKIMTLERQQGQEGV